MTLPLSDQIDRLTVDFMQLYPNGVPGPEGRRLAEMHAEALELETEVARITALRTTPDTRSAR
jgi:hypothetical protein